MMDDTRARILRAALEEFSARGYHETSVRELAERVGVTKTAVLYHFPGKADIVTALAEPMLADLEAALARAAAAPDARRAAIEGLLDVWLAHRYLIRMNLRDLGLTASAVVFERFRDGMLRANELVAGPDAGFAARVRAAQAIAMLSDPVVLFADTPPAELRAAILDGVDRLFTVAGGVTSGCGQASASGSELVGAAVGDHSRRGRPPAMSSELVEGRRGRALVTTSPELIETAAGVEGRRSGSLATASESVEVTVGDESNRGGSSVTSSESAEPAAGDESRRTDSSATSPEPTEPATKGKIRSRRGRPPAMSPATIEAARRLHAAGRAPADIAAALGVSRATIYRHLTAAD